MGHHSPSFSYSRLRLPFKPFFKNNFTRLSRAAGISKSTVAPPAASGVASQALSVLPSLRLAARNSASLAVVVIRVTGIAFRKMSR
ncbi:Uncharacterised protein [Mycobacterium tuberculosis]|nr:Uncharacterised protein [Mycobacterium tuberculosis]